MNEGSGDYALRITSDRDETRATVGPGGDEAVGLTVVDQDDKSPRGEKDKSESEWKVLPSAASRDRKRAWLQTRTRGNRPFTEQWTISDVECPS